MALRCELLESRLVPDALALGADGRTLFRFDEAAPGNVRGTITVTGLAGNEGLVAIDVRPATGRLYGLATAGATARLVTVATTGLATPIGAPFPLNGVEVGFDFDPAADRLRVTTDKGANLSIHPDTGAVTTDTPINPGAPVLTGLAYSPAAPGIVSRLFGIDTATDTLVTLDNPPNGQLKLVGGMAFDFGPRIGFDIRPDGRAFAASPFSGGSGLLAIDLVTGQANGVGPIGTGLDLRGLALLLPTPSANECYVSQVYRDLLGRAPDAAGLAFYAGQLDRGEATRAGVAAALQASTEYRVRAIDDLYRRYLDRPLDPAGQAAWLAFLDAGGRLEGVAASILGSDEYFARAGGTTGGFLQAIYRDVLGRELDPGGQATWGGLLAAGNSRTFVANCVLGSVESNRREVDALYQATLRRSPDASGREAFGSLLDAGASNEQARALLLGSDEYFARFCG